MEDESDEDNFDELEPPPPRSSSKCEQRSLIYNRVGKGGSSTSSVAVADNELVQADNFQSADYLNFRAAPTIHKDRSNNKFSNSGTGIVFDFVDCILQTAIYIKKKTF